MAIEKDIPNDYEKPNTYPGINPIIVRIVQHLARSAVGRCGLTSDDVADLEQELIIAVLSGLKSTDTTSKVPYNLAKCIAERRLKGIFRRRSMQSRDWKKCRQSLNEELPGLEDDEGFELIDLIDENHHLCLNDSESWRGTNPEDTRMDVTNAYARMDPEQQKLCDELKEHSQRHISRSWNKSRDWIAGKLKTLSSFFADKTPQKENDIPNKSK